VACLRIGESEGSLRGSLRACYPNNIGQSWHHICLTPSRHPSWALCPAPHPFNPFEASVLGSPSCATSVRPFRDIRPMALHPAPHPSTRTGHPSAQSGDLSRGHHIHHRMRTSVSMEDREVERRWLTCLIRAETWSDRQTEIDVSRGPYCPDPIDRSLSRRLLTAQ
jgi:hypothetical protein